MNPNRAFEYFDPDAEELDGLGLVEHLLPDERVKWIKRPTLGARLVSDFDAYYCFVLAFMATGPIFLITGYLRPGLVANVEFWLALMVVARLVSFLSLSRNYFFWITNKRFGFRFFGTGVFERRSFKSRFRANYKRMTVS